MNRLRCFLVLLCVAPPCVPLAFAQIDPLDEHLGDSYYYVDHFEVVLEKRLSEVWPTLVDLSSWMPGLAEANEPLPDMTQGAVFHLYDDFYMEVAKIIPERMILLVNLPGSQQGEDTQGIAMISTHGVGDKTIVSIFMSRIFFWFEAEENPLRERRNSVEFVEARRSSYEDDILQRLREAVENSK